MSEYQILIVDDHPVVREGLRVILSQLQGVKCTLCESVEKLTNMLNRNIRHDLYILDLEFPKSDIFPFLDRISQQFPDSKILIYSMHEDPWMLSHIDPSKIHGYVSKSDSMDILLGAVNKLRDGIEAFSEAYIMAKKKRKPSAASADKVELTEREKQVLYYLSKGYTTQEIADKLHVSYFTAKAHRNHLAKKLNAKNAIEIIIKGKKYL